MCPLVKEKTSKHESGRVLTARKVRCLTQRQESLFKELRHLPPADRRSVLRTFTEEQRRSLERWILLKGRFKRKAKAPRACPRLARRHCGQGCAVAPSGIHRHRRAGRVVYRAGTNLGPFRLFSGYHADRGKAQQRMEALACLRRRTLRKLQALSPRGSCEPGVASKGSKLEVAFRSTLSEYAQSDVGWLRILAQIPAKPWVGRSLVVPTFPAYGTGLDRGLRAFRRLSEFRESLPSQPRMAFLDSGKLAEAWTQLRSAYFDVCVEAGQRPDKVSAKLTRWEDARVQQQKLSSSKLGELSLQDLDSSDTDPLQVDVCRLPKACSAASDKSRGLCRRMKDSKRSLPCFIALEFAANKASKSDPGQL